MAFVSSSRQQVFTIANKKKYTSTCVVQNKQERWRLFLPSRAGVHAAAVLDVAAVTNQHGVEK